MRKWLIGPRTDVERAADPPRCRSEGRLPPPGAAVATRAMLDDPRAEPEYGERVPYLMFQAEPGQPQVHRAISPEEFLADP